MKPHLSLTILLAFLPACAPAQTPAQLLPFKQAEVWTLKATDPATRTPYQFSLLMSGEVTRNQSNQIQVLLQDKTGRAGAITYVPENKLVLVNVLLEQRDTLLKSPFVFCFLGDVTNRQPSYTGRALFGTLSDVLDTVSNGDFANSGSPCSFTLEGSSAASRVVTPSETKLNLKAASTILRSLERR